jgi:hypothetical protein
VESLGARGGIVLDNVAGSSAHISPLFAMSGDGTDDVSIPFVFLFQADGQRLMAAVNEDPSLTVTIQESPSKNQLTFPYATERNDEINASFHLSLSRRIYEEAL